jgi:hypothetical protein
MKPQDILPDNINTVEVDGKILRKGSVAAFMANIAIIDQPANYPEYENAVKDLIELTPVLETLGVFKHFRLRSEKAIALITDIYPHLTGRIS